MKKIVFTLCSNNYLAHAKTLGDSLTKTNPDIIFKIGLTDLPDPSIDYSFFDPFEIIGYNKIGFDFEEMVTKYNVIEFNTSVKPFYFEYLFKVHGEESLVYYLDPDIFVFKSLQGLHDVLGDFDFVLTPHITIANPTPAPHENVILNVGIYNLGFMGMRHSSDSMLFLKWWQNRLRDYCYIDYPNGLFVDQLWVNFIHIFFKKVHVLRSPGFNMAYWNFVERKLLMAGEHYFVNNEESPLVFFHFSGFNPLTPSKFTKDKKAAEFTPESRPDLVKVFEFYANWLLSNRYEHLHKIAPALKFRPLKVLYTKKQQFGRRLRKRIDTYLAVYFKM